MNKMIFVIDDDDNIRQLIAKFLESEGFQVKEFASAEGVLAAMQMNPPDCLVLDVMMPGENGLDLCREIRNSFNTPIIFVSAKSEEIDRILGIELGGDDYLIKPFSPRELVVRVKALLRRSNRETTSINTNKWVFGNVTIDIDARLLLINDQAITLTNKEYELLLYFLEHANKAMSREQIVDAIWGYDYIGEMRSVDDLVRRLRKKLHHDQATIEIETVWGYGYKLKEN